MSRGIWLYMSARTRRLMTSSWAALFVFSLLMQYGSFAAPATTLAVHNDGLFELDRNATTQVTHDWDQVFADHENGTTTSGTSHVEFVHDAINSTPDEHLFTQGGSKDEQPISAWHWTTGAGVQDKNDIEDVYAASYSTAAGHRLVYFGLDRFATSGDAFIGFWFLKGAVGEAAGGTFSGAHQNGDVLVQVNFTNGGVIQTFIISHWENGAIVQDATGADCSDPATPADDFACGVVNQATISSPWPFTPKAGTADNIPAGGFFEAGIDLTHFGLADSCFSSFIGETRSSQSLTSTLSDYALGSFSFCSPPTIVTTASASSISIGSSVTDTATFTGGSGAVTGTVKFYVCGPSGSNPDCSTNGTLVGATKTIASGSATSDAFTPSAAGSYCFRAEYTPDQASVNKYLPGSHTNTTTECFVVKAPNISIVKTADAAAVSAGDAIGFTVTATNNGAGDAAGFKINDPLPAGTGVSWSIASTTPASDANWVISGSAPNQTLTYGGANGVTLAAGASVSVHVTSGTTKDSCGAYDNTATFTTTNDGTGSASASTTVNCASIAVTKVADAASVSAGDQIGFTVTLTNNGAGTAKGLAFSDPLPAGADLSWTISPASAGWSIVGGNLVYAPTTLAAGASSSVHVVSPTTQEDCGVVNNTATVTTSNDGSGQASASVTVNCPSLSITKTADAASVSAGDPIGFVITVANGGPGVARSVTLSDALPTGAGISWSIDAGGSDSGCSISGGDLLCDFGDLAAGASRHVHITSPTTKDSCGLYPNTATVSATNSPSFSASASTMVECAAISITKVADAASVSAGSPIGFVITITNSGAGTAHGVTMTDTLPVAGGLAWSIDAGGSSAGFSINAGALGYGPADLAPGASVHVHITSPTTSASCGTVDNTASVTTSNDGSAQASDSVDVLCPAINVSKTADAASVSAGTPIGFTVVVSNNGAGTATGVTLADALPGGNAATPVHWTIDGALGDPGKFSITGADGSQQLTLAGQPISLAAGASLTVHVTAATTSTSCTTYNNTASVASSNDGSGSASASVTVNCAAIAITKVADAHVVAAGSQIGFKITVSNNGEGTATGVHLADTLPTDAGTSWTIDGSPTGDTAGLVCGISAGALVCDKPSLAPGQSFSVHIVSPTTTATVADSPVDNTATVTTTNDGSGQASDSIRIPALGIAKSFTGNSLPPTTVGNFPQAAEGDKLTYTLAYTLTNGPVTNGVITDVLPAGQTYVAGSAAGNDEFTFQSYNAATRTLTWTAPTVTKSGSVTYQVTIDTGANELAQPLHNVATIDSDETSPGGATADVFVPAPPKEITQPPTDTLPTRQPGNPGFSLMLLLLALAGFALTLGFVTPVPERVRRHRD